MESKGGLDIGSHSIKVIEIVRHGNTETLISAGSIATPPKALNSNIKADQQSISLAIKQLFKQAGVRNHNIILALPESSVFTRVIEVPSLSERELASAIRWEAEQYIPLPLDQVNIDFTILRNSKDTGTNKMQVLLVASPKALIEKYINIIDHADLNPVAAETEIISASRALIRTVANIKTAMIVSLGAQTTDLSILRNGVLSFTRSISAGGEALSRALVQNLDFNQVQAEQFKQTYGLQKDQLEGKILTAVKPIIDTVTSEMKRAITYYQEKNAGENIEVIMITGGTARLPGIVLYMAEATGVEVQLGNPWIGIKRDAKFAKLDPDGPTYCVAIGLALRS